MTIPHTDNGPILGDFFFFLRRGHFLSSNCVSSCRRSTFSFVVRVLCEQTFDALALIVKSEDKGGEIILESKIQTEDIYQLQQGTP